MNWDLRANMYYSSGHALYNCHVTPYKGHMNEHSPRVGETKIPQNGARRIVARIGLKVLNAFWPALMRFGSPKLTPGAILSVDAYDFHSANARYACGETIGIEDVAPSLND